MRRNIVCIAAVMSLAAAAAASPERTTPVAVGTATLELPAGWESMPTHRLRMNSLFGPGTEEYLSMSHWTDAFRPPPTDDVARMPVIIVEVYETGRMSWREFATVVRDAEARRVTAGEGSEPLARALLESSWSLDPAGRRFRAESVFDAPGGTPVSISSMTVLTERGTITVHGITEAAGPVGHHDLVDRIQNSLIVDPEVAHRWHPSDVVDELNQLDLRLRLGIAGALVFGGLLIAYRTLRVGIRPR